MLYLVCVRARARREELVRDVRLFDIATFARLSRARDYLGASINSARYSNSSLPNYPFVPILDPVRKNHSTIGDASVASGVLGAILSIQPVH